MDDIFQLLIWLFIIISFFASFFKKKKPQQPAPSQRYEEPEENFPVKEQSGRSVDKEEYDILREIESMFKTDTSQPTRTEQRQNQNETFRTESEHVSYERARSESEYTSYEKKPLEIQKMDTSRSRGEHTFTSSEHSYEVSPNKYDKARQKVRKIDASVSKQAEAFEKFLQSKQTGNSMATLIRNRIKQPSTLKEYIIMSEILGKPKAFN